MRVFAVAFCSFLSLTCLLAAAQSGNQTPASAVNLPHPDTTQNPGLTALQQSGRETVDLGMGSIGLYLPVLDLPQRGGRSLKLGYVMDSDAWSIKETSVTYNQYGTANASNPQTWWFETYATLSWVQAHTPRSAGHVHTNIPTLSADMMYMGAEQQGSGAATSFTPSYCLTDWTFTDWTGSSHSFNGYRDCVSWRGQFGPNSWLTTKEAEDDSGYQIDLRDPNDPKIVGPNGDVFHFASYTPPANDNGAGTYKSGYVQLNYYTSTLSQSVDANGNAITISNGVLTDTVGRQIQLGSNGSGFSWQYEPSPSAATVTASVSASDSNSGQTIPFDRNGVTSCTAVPPNSYMGGGQAAGYHGPQVSQPQDPEVYSDYTSIITLADSSKYTLHFNQKGQLTKIYYPSGGYSRYEYSTPSSTQTNDGDMMCTRPHNTVFAKHECTLASGACAEAPTTTPEGCKAGVESGGELTTCYGATSDTFANSAMVVTNPKGDQVGYAFTPSYTEPANGNPGWVPHFHTRKNCFGLCMRVALRHLCSELILPTKHPQIARPIPRM